MNDTEQDASFVLNYKVDWSFETMNCNTIENDCLENA